MLYTLALSKWTSDCFEQQLGFDNRIRNTMHNIIISDVFGRTHALEQIASSLSGATDILDPYNSINMDFNNEVEAYSCFTTKVGLDKYADTLKECIQSFSEQTQSDWV